MNIIFETKAIPSQTLEELVGKEIDTCFEIKSEECFIWIESVKTAVVGDDVTTITMMGGKIYKVPTTDWIAYMKGK